MVAPTSIVGRVGCRVDRQAAILYAGLHTAREPTVHAAQPIDLSAMVVEAVFHIDRNRAANGVEAEHRVVGLQGEFVDGDFREERPIDDVAIGFVDANAVLIDGDALRGAGHRRRHKAAVVEILLIWIAGLVFERCKRKAACQSLEQVGRLRVLEILRPHRLRNIGRYLVPVDPAACNRRDIDEVGGRRDRLGRRRRWCGDWLGDPHGCGNRLGRPHWFGNWLADLHGCGRWLWEHFRLGRRDATRRDRFLGARGLFGDGRLGRRWWRLFLRRDDLHFGQLGASWVWEFDAASRLILGTHGGRQGPERKACQQRDTRALATA
jgi:hypothetical protein